jgi:hypothetical protein
MALVPGQFVNADAVNADAVNAVDALLLKPPTNGVHDRAEHGVSRRVKAMGHSAHLRTTSMYCPMISPLPSVCDESLDRYPCPALVAHE